MLNRFIKNFEIYYKEDTNIFVHAIHDQHWINLLLGSRKGMLLYRPTKHKNVYCNMKINLLYRVIGSYGYDRVMQVT